MARRGASADGASDDDEYEEPDEASPRSRRSRRRPPSPRPKRTSPVRRWRASEESEDDDEDELDATPTRHGLFHRDSHPVYWRARDSLYFEPLVAVAIIVVLLASLYAYTGNWPPVYVVESNSMQHGSTDILGLINTGDLVLAQRIPTGQITPYVVGLQTGYSTYGEYGDVILYSANGEAGTPIIHRAILFLEWNPASSSYNATDLAGLRCGSMTGAVYNATGTPGNCGTTNLTGTLTLYHIGWRSTTVVIDLSSPNLGRHSGFVTMGDNNFLPYECTRDCVQGDPDQTDGLSELVEPGWVIGAARGMLPWFGAVKLALEGNTAMVPPQSWQFLGLTIAGLILLAFGIHYAFRAEGIEDQRRKDQEAEDAAERGAEDDPGPPGGGRGGRFLRAIRPWGRSDDDIEDEEEQLRPRARSAPPRAPSSGRRRGRPSPKVRRGDRSKHKRRDGGDDDL
ncbi:MAG: S26 family signal peptidase [Thermoplasmata archaeon]